MTKLKKSHSELLTFAKNVRAIYECKDSYASLALRSLFELTYHLDEEHPESVCAMIKRAERVLAEHN